jgi:hypothetical protein
MVDIFSGHPARDIDVPLKIELHDYVEVPSNSWR